MSFPANSPAPRNLAEPAIAALAAALLEGAQQQQQQPIRLLSAHYSSAARKLVLLCAPGSGGAIAKLRPSMAALLAVPQGGAGGAVEGVTLTARGVAGDAVHGVQPHFVQRYWSPWNLPSGEDPVNGSSHTVLAPFWAAAEGVAEGEALVSLGLSPRGGLLRVGVEGGGGSVFLEGEAVTWAEGRMWV